MKKKVFILAILIVSFSFNKIVIAQPKHDVIYPLNGVPIACEISDVSGAEVKYKPVENLAGPVYTKLKQDAILIFKSNGEFMIPSNSSSTWTKGADPGAHKIITRNHEIYPAKFVEPREDKITYVDAKNNKNYEFKKDEILLILYKDGEHETMADISEVVKGLHEITNRIDKYAESVNSNELPSDEFIDLSEAQQKHYSEKALLKANDFGKYLGVISNKDEIDEEKVMAIDAAVALFISDTVKVEVSSLNRPEKRYFYVKEYLDRLRRLPYDKVDMMWMHAALVSRFRKGEGNKYYGTITAVQLFRAYNDNKLEYQDVTEKNIDVVLTQYDVFVDGVNKPKWEIFLSNIGVKQTMEK